MSAATGDRSCREPLDLDRLASVAATSKFHFLRTFRRVVGLTPCQFLLNTRLRHAALQLLLTRDPVSAIAFDCGFGDLSTFNSTFRARFGANPMAFRRTGPLHRQAAAASGGVRCRAAIAAKNPLARRRCDRYSPCPNVKNR